MFIHFTYINKALGLVIQWLVATHTCICIECTAGRLHAEILLPHVCLTYEQPSVVAVPQ